MAEEEATRASAGEPSLHEVSASSFIVAGLNLEEQQYVSLFLPTIIVLHLIDLCRRKVRLDVMLKKATTSAQKADLVDERTRLGRNIARFRALQSTYTPIALRYISNSRPIDSTVAPTFIEDIPLYLPSALDAHDRANGTTEDIAVMEATLREAQCRTSLEQLRTQLHIKSRLLTYKGRNVRNQAPNTRARALIDRNDAKIKAHVLKYREAREALRRLQGVPENEFSWRKLEDKDIRCMEDPEQLERDEDRRARAREKGRQAGSTATGGLAVGEGRRTISWLFIDTETGEGSLKGVYEGYFVSFVTSTYTDY